MLMPTILKSFVSDDAGVAVVIVVCKGSHAAQTPVMNFSQTSGNFSQTSGNFSMVSEGLNVGFHYRGRQPKSRFRRSAVLA